MDDDILEFEIPRSRGDTSAGRVAASARGNAELTRETAVIGQDIVELQLVNGPTLFLHPEHARELFAAQSAASRSEGSGRVRVPTRLGWRTSDLDRARDRGLGEVSQAVVHAFEIVKETVSSRGANWVARGAAAALDHRVAPGLRPLDEAPPALTGDPVAVRRGDKPLLVLLHGTFNTTRESFGGLWDHPGFIARLRQKFAVYAFDHPTLTKSPLSNAIELAKLLPVGAEVSFLTYSRGGLVAEALAQLADGKETSSSCFKDEKYDEQRGELTELQQVSAERKLRIQRIVRVACPARGTLLASTRLDVYLSVLKWGLELAQVPVAKELVGFLHEVAKRRTKPDELPGLEAMMPDSAFIRWLHQSDLAIDGELRVVAGDLQGDSLSSWLKTLVSDAYFWTDNDLIVQTRSMYAGRPRQGGSLYLLERGAKVDHFKYFSNRSIASAIVRAATDDELQDFQSIGPLSQEGQSSSGSRARLTNGVAESKSKAKPAVIVVPGILGSQLRADGELVWLGARIINGIDRLAYREPGDVTPGDWFAGYYDGLARHLAPSHEVIPFPYDWRKPIETEAKRLASVIEEARRGRSEPVRIIAHSQGGLVARTVEKVEPEVWATVMQHERSRLLLLGTPNSGSWAPMQVLSGDNLLGNLLAHVGALFHEHEARALFAALPAFIQLQAGLLDPDLRLNQQATWEQLEKSEREQLSFSTLWHSLPIQRKSQAWGIPPQALLDAAGQLHAWLSKQELRRLGRRVLVVVGNGRETPSGFERSPSFGYLQTDRGDGTVTVDNALLPGVRAFQVGVEHSRLAAAAELYPGYLSLLEHGEPSDAAHFTSLLSMRGGPPAADVQASGRARRAPRRRGWSNDELDAEGMFTLTASGVPAPRGASAPALRVAVTNGDLTFVNQPLMLGHYRSLALTGAEKVIDDFLGGTLTMALRLQRYPTLTGEAKVFENKRKDPKDPHAIPRPPAVVIVGLGAEGELRAEELAMTVRQGVIEYALKIAGDLEPGSSFELATTLIGSGGMGVAVATAARAIAQGVYAANERLLEREGPIVARLNFIEVYEDRATEALTELLAIADQKPAVFEVERWLNTGMQARPSPLTASYRGTDYDMVSVLDGPPVDGKGSIVFTTNTRRARTEARSTTTQLPLLQALIDQSQADRHGDQQLGKTLYRVLVPCELDSFFSGSEAVSLEVDGATAGVPWELLSVGLDEDSTDTQPWSIRAKLVRKLQTRQFREQPISSGQDALPLVIGDPFVDDRSQYPSLPGALREADAVASVLNVPEGALRGAKAVELVNALLSSDRSIVHIAGHGKEDGSGVVMSGNLILGADLIRSMRRVPDLVFVNCCHSARQHVGQLPGQASTLARGLIDVGVRCVIVTGWAVDDDAAEHFARTLYDRLLRRHRFRDATAAARESTWSSFKGSNTWAAYQCYGDPDWVLRRHLDGGEGKPPAAPVEQVYPDAPIVSAAGLVITLKTLALDDRSRAVPRVKELEAELGERFGQRGDAAEAFADAYSQLGEAAHAIRWYERAVRAEVGATFRSLEQLFNLSVRQSANNVESAFLRWEEAKPAAREPAHTAALREAIESATKAFEGRKKDLARLAGLPPTSERMSLVGSAWKRRAMIAYASHAALNTRGARAVLLRALQQSRAFYEKAAALARQEHGKNVGYAALNTMTVRLVLELVSGQKPSVDRKEIEEVKQHLEQWQADESEFWPFVQQVELDVYEGVCTGELPAKRPRIEERFADLWRRKANPREWDSVRSQAIFLLRPYLATGVSPEQAAAADRIREVLSNYASVKP